MHVVLEHGFFLVIDCLQSAATWKEHEARSQNYRTRRIGTREGRAQEEKFRPNPFYFKPLAFVIALILANAKRKGGLPAVYCWNRRSSNFMCQKWIFFFNIKEEDKTFLSKSFELKLDKMYWSDHSPPPPPTAFFLKRRPKCFISWTNKLNKANYEHNKKGIGKFLAKLRLAFFFLPSLVLFLGGGLLTYLLCMKSSLIFLI